MPMRRGLVATLVGLACHAMAAESAYAPQSASCRRALAALDAEEAVAASAPRGTVPLAPLRVKALRADAARTCLGAEAEAAPPAQRFSAPLAVPPVVVERSLPLPPMRAPSSAPVRSAPPKVITACDAMGCWASDGTRVQRIGPILQGPHGVCSVAGSVLQCP